MSKEVRPASVIARNPNPLTRHFLMLVAQCLAHLDYAQGEFNAEVDLDSEGGMHEGFERCNRAQVNAFVELISNVIKMASDYDIYIELHDIGRAAYTEDERRRFAENRLTDTDIRDLFHQLEPDSFDGTPKEPPF